MPSTSHVTRDFSDSSGSVKDSRFQHGKARTTKHHALDHFEPVHVSFDLPIAPVVSHRRSDCRFIFHQASGKTLQFLQSALLDGESPLSEQAVDASTNAEAVAPLRRRLDSLEL
jgi:hypothetical protein